MNGESSVNQRFPNPTTFGSIYFWQRRRFWIWSFILFIVTVIAFVACLPTTRALVQFHRVKAGMTEQEVIDLLGRSTNRIDFGKAHPGREGLTCRAWYIGELSFWIEFQDDKAIKKQMNSDLPIARRYFSRVLGRNLL